MGFRSLLVGAILATCAWVWTIPVAAVEEPQGYNKKYTYREIEGAKLSLFVYSPGQTSTGRQLPAIVFFHGGGWRGGSPTQFQKQCQYFRDRDMVAVTVEYRLVSGSKIKIDDCVEDAKSAIGWVRANSEKLGVDPNRIAAAGGSAGGHLAACTAIAGNSKEATTEGRKTNSKPNALVLFNPVMILTTDVRMTASEKQQIEKLVSDRTKAKPHGISPLAHAKRKLPPCIMFFGTKDRLLRPAQWFRDDATSVGNQCEIKTYEGKGHGFFNNGTSYTETVRESDRFLTKLGWLDQIKK